MEHLRNEDQERRIYRESIRVKEKESGRKQVIYTVNIYRTKSSLLINSRQKVILEVIPIIQLWALENKSRKNLSDQKLKEVLGKLKVGPQQSKIKGHEKKEELDDEDNTKAFDSVIERKNRKAKIGIDDRNG